MEGLLRIDPGLLIWTIITFVVVVAALWKFAWTPILSALEVRSDKIKHDLDSAERRKREAEQLFAEYKEKLLEAERESQRRIEEAKNEALRQKDQMLRDAAREADDIRKRMERDIQKAKETALREIKTYAADLVVGATRRILEDSIGGELDLKILEQSIAKYTVNLNN